MNKYVFLSVLCLLLGLSSFAQSISTNTTPPFNYHRDFKAIFEQTKADTSALYYDKLLARFLLNDSSLTHAETLALMIGFTEDPYYKPLEDMESELEIFEHNKSSEFHEAIEKGRPFLEHHPLSLLTLREVSFAYNRLGKEYSKNSQFDSAVICQDSSKYFMDLNDKIMEAMIYSGKGRRTDNPIFSLGLADGEYFLPNVGYEIEKKATDWNRDKDFMEIIQVVNDQAVSINYYFVIQHAKVKIDNDKANEMASKKNKKPAKKKSKEKTSPKKNKTAIIPFIEPIVTDSIPVINQ